MFSPRSTAFLQLIPWEPLYILQSINEANITSKIITPNDCVLHIYNIYINIYIYKQRAYILWVLLHRNHKWEGGKSCAFLVFNRHSSRSYTDYTNIVIKQYSPFVVYHLLPENHSSDLEAIEWRNGVLDQSHIRFETIESLNIHFDINSFDLNLCLMLQVCCEWLMKGMFPSVPVQSMAIANAFKTLLDKLMAYWQIG